MLLHSCKRSKRISVEHFIELHIHQKCEFSGCIKCNSFVSYNIINILITVEFWDLLGSIKKKVHYNK